MPEQNKIGISDNALGAFAYFTVVPAIFFLAIPPYNKSAYVRFHAWQSTVLSALAFMITVVLSFFPEFNTSLVSVVYLGLYMLIWLLWALISLWCAMCALHGKRFKLPGLGAWAERQSNR
jgi:uncharacterized membrane protein